MRRPTENLTALQVLTAILPVTLLLVLALVEVRRSPSVAGHWSHATRIIPRYLTRLFHHGPAAARVTEDATVTPQPPVQGKSDAQ